ncbi:pilus assembly protein PilM [[Clostridium] polysaccharolyticum]|uniref:Type IV pilus assembly protein PilM n=1 Tax=[Clostridium] polysaccharolyticum TaxID=29364 RepID=A0A1H9ZSD6_9FIRM|nr:pilus assembly protein PilM [[Clostridium] polysaccharolyticum]SES84265.1 type IV pilus assembly protein PilM [[Clostridium] polysaccharolyticum]
MAKKVLSIEIGLRYTRICEMAGLKVTPVVYNCITFPTPEGSFEDGYIRDKGILGAAIRQQLIEHKIKTTDAVFTVNSTKIANREVYIPYVSENKIKSIVELQAKDYFPIDISDYNISYYILNKEDKAKGQDRKIKLLLLAAPDNLIQSYYNLAAAMGIQVEAIDYIGNSFYQVAKRQWNQGVNIFVHINDNTTLVNIIEDENLLLQRIIPYGSNEIVEKVSRNEVFHVESEEAAIALLKKEKIINYQFEPEKDNDITFMSASEGYDQVRKEIKAKEDVTESLKFLVNNMIRVLDYFTAKNSAKKIGYIYVSGFGSSFQGIVQLLKNEIGFETKKIDNIYVAEFNKKVILTPAEQVDYIACVGAGIAPVNFGVKQKAGLGMKKTDVKSWKNACVFVCVLCGVFAGTMAFVKIQSVAKQNVLKSDINELQGVEVIYDNYNAAKAKYENLNKMHERTISKVDCLDKILEDLEEKLPAKLNLTGLTVNQEQLIMEAEGSGPLAISKLFINLRDIPYLTNLQVDSYSSTSSEGSSGVPAITFKITADFSETDIYAGLEADRSEDKAENNDASNEDSK